MVLAHVTNKLSSHVTYLTVQVFKDDWLRSSSTTKLTNIAGSPLIHSSTGFPRVNQSNAATKTHSHSHGHGHAHAHGVTAPVVAKGNDRTKIIGRPSQKLYAGPLS